MITMVSAEEDKRVESRARRAVRIEDVTDADAELIAHAEVPTVHTHLDALLDDRHS